jgi:hypothetical protein
VFQPFAEQTPVRRNAGPRTSRCSPIKRLRHRRRARLRRRPPAHLGPGRGQADRSPWPGWRALGRLAGGDDGLGDDGLAFQTGQPVRLVHPRHGQPSSRAGGWGGSRAAVPAPVPSAVLVSQHGTRSRWRTSRPRRPPRPPPNVPGSARAAVPNAACPKPRLPARRMRRLAVVVKWYDLVVEAFRIGPGQLVQVICGRRHRRDLSAEWARTPGATKACGMAT